MAEPDKRQIGDGSDNYGEAAKQMAKAAKEAGIETAKQAAVKGAEAGANAAAATVQAGVEGGKAVAEIAAGTAAGGPWGAILSAAWAMRHTLFKILVCICLFFLVIIVLIVSLPSVVTNSVFGLDGSMVDMENPTTLLESYNHLAADISAVVEEGYDAALAKVEQIIEDGGYDYDLSMDALINYAQGSAGYDVSYILAAYSASLQQRNTGKEDMLAKLRSVADSMFPVAFVEKESEQIVPFTYATYRPVTVTVVTSKTQTGTINGVPQYRYTTARRTYYEPDETITTSEPVNVAAYTPVVVSVPIYSGGRITGTRSETYYEQDGNETLTPETEVVKINKNANLNLLGTSGAGKTFTMQLLALRMRMRGIQCYILAPIKGHEFRRACNKIGGEFIKIAPGSPHCINVMEIRHTMSPEMELIDEIDYVEMGSMLARKIQQLMTFFGLLIPDMSNEEEQMLDEALIRTYADFGITHDNDSIYTDMSSVPPKMKQMPILGDLHKHLQENPMTQRLAAIISRFVTGSAQSFNRQTNVDLSNKYIVLDLSELKGKLLPVGMFIALDYVWDQIKSDRTKRKAIFIDEIWQLIGASSNRMAAEFCLEIFKVIRGFGGAAISATQDLSDFFGLEDGKYGRAIINNSKNKIILNLEPDEARYVQETLKLTRTEIRAITRFERGEALISSNNNKVPVVVKASKLEKEMITTDRAELEAILKERQREKTHSA